MAVKFNQYWIVNHDKTSNYSKFIIKDYIPGMNKLGIHIVAGWVVLVGGYSEVLLEGVTNDLELLECALRNDNCAKLRIGLQQYVKNYKTKVLISTKLHDSYSTDVNENVTKIIQAWDIIRSKKSEYKKFVNDEFYPMLRDMSIRVANEWEVLIGDGPNIICEGRAKKIDGLLDNLKSELFQSKRALLKKFIYNYESRLLTPHVCKNLGYKAVYYSVISV